MSLISIIVQVYNTERYLHKCLDSIFENNFDDIEIIIVDDFSNVKRREIVEEYQKKYSNIKYIKLEKNYELMLARDIAIKYASSKYIMCISSDDYIEKNTLESLSKELENDYDIIAFNYLYENKNRRRSNPYYEYEIKKNLVINDVLRNIEVLLSKRMISLSCKIIKKEVYEKINIESENINYLEDYLITLKLFYYAKNIKYISTPYYITMQKPDNMGNLYMLKSEQIESILERLAFISSNIYTFLKEKKIFDSVRSYIENFEYTTYQLMYSEITGNKNKKQIKNIDSLFSKALPSIKKYNDILDKIEDAKQVKPQISLSIVIPVFNTESYLHRCLNSVLVNQTFNDIEVIIVDDCSHGNCKEIAEEYKNAGYNIIYIRNTENMGSAWSRINGASYTKGKYIHFIDSDDWVVDDCYTKQMKYIDNKYDALYFSHYIAYDDNVKIENINEIVDTTLNGKRQAFDDMFFNPLERSRTLWARIFLRKCVLEATKYMPKLWISIADDWIFNLFILFYVKKYKAVSDYFYYYYQDNPIAMTTAAENRSNINSEKLNRLITQYYYAAGSLVSFFLTNKIWNTYRINWSVYIAADLQHHFINTLSGFERYVLNIGDENVIYEECINFLNNKTSLTNIFSFIRYNDYLSYELSIRKFNQFSIKNFLYIMFSRFIIPRNLLKVIFSRNETDDRVYIKLFGFNITILKKQI